ncbi:MBL fold metallo-hydrolase [Mycobacterium sp. IDR2000157661]|uniref:MBL fold metallo-hydrolase n=1 Tax=Mycobacterium sp. IDR2000157661 TaxID=2867005 RepID=UPI001EEBE3E5|nr:MBL fold metallo-hydrolase [Mycobacterium sp. IDR2000157661]ULE32327.1 MBL fold metallo-hydrolase [Mycobacterium sp. IDR2000157661]
MVTSTTRKANQLNQIREDLWQTRLDTPFPGLTTHSYLWRGPKGNVLFYSPATDADFDAIQALGGVRAQYLSHLDEAGPNLARIAERFGSRLHAPAAELADITRHAPVDVPIEDVRRVDDTGVEVLPTPGHSPGSTSYLVTGTDGARYLFTGDTLYRTGDGAWAAGLLPPRGDAAALRDSVTLLASVQPDVVLSSAFGGHSGLEIVDARRWADIVGEALASLPS